jgi:predicted ArsR family transcriptional regulator
MCWNRNNFPHTTDGWTEDVNLDKRFFETTRGQIITLLREGPRSVDELARSMGLTDNAIRAHLSTLERDGLVRQTGVRRLAGAGKPATLYEVHPAAEPLFSRAYAPVLEALVEELATELSAEQRESLMQAVARRRAAEVGRPPKGSLSQRVEAATAVLDSWGGAAKAEQQEGALVIRGTGGCPLSGSTAHRAELCRAMEALLSQLVGAPVRECCDRGERPRCRFEIPLEQRGAPKPR